MPSGLDASGNFTSRQLQFPLDLSFAGIFGQPTTSSTQAEVNFGNVTLILDSDPGFKTDYTVEITPAADYGPMMIGVITNIDTSSGQTLITVAVFRALGGGIFTNWNIKVIGGPTGSIPASQALAVDNTDSFAMPSPGTVLSLTVEKNKLFVAGGQVYLQALVDYTTSALAIVQNYNASTGAISIFVTNASGVGNTYALWTVALTGNLAPFVPILGRLPVSVPFWCGGS